MERNQRKTSVELGPQHPAGDPGFLPGGASREMLNLVRVAPNRLITRDPHRYDGLEWYDSLLKWEDQENRTTRLLAYNRPALEIKGVTGETWASAAADVGFGSTNFGHAYVSSYCTHRGKLYISFAGADYNNPFNITTGLGEAAGDGYAVPLGSVLAFDGTAVSTPVPSGMAPLFVVAYRQRLYLIGGGFFFQPYLNHSYDVTHADWTKTNVTAANIVLSGTTLCRITPTNTTSAQIQYDAAIPATSLPEGSNQSVSILAMLRPADASYSVPLTLQIALFTAAARSTFYDDGAVVVADGGGAGNGFRYRSTVAGTTGGAAPAWPTTVGTTVADGTATWINDGPDYFAELEIDLPTASEGAAEPIPYYVSTTIPETANAIRVTTRLKFGNSAVSTWQLASVDVSFKDGVADYALDKKNFGFMMVNSDYWIPFHNIEGTGPDVTLLTPNVIRWAEVYDTRVRGENSDSLEIRASNSYAITEAAASMISGAIVADDFLVVFTPQQAFIFEGVDNPDLPFQRVGSAHVGALAHTGIDTHEGRIFFVGDEEVYRWTPGGAVEPLCGDGMRDTVMDRGADWVGNNVWDTEDDWDHVTIGTVDTLYQAQGRPLLKVDKKNRIVYVHTQKGKLFAYCLQSGEWFTHTLGVDAILTDLIYHPVTKKMYATIGTDTVGITYGLVRFDPTEQKDTYNAAATEYAIAPSITTRAFEVAPGQVDILVEDVTLHSHNLSDQTDQTLTVSYSRDSGETFTSLSAVEMLDGNGKVKNTVSVMQQGEDLVLKFAHSGEGGEGSFNVSHVEATIQRLGDYVPQERPS